MIRQKCLLLNNSILEKTQILLECPLLRVEIQKVNLYPLKWHLSFDM